MKTEEKLAKAIERLLKRHALYSDEGYGIVLDIAAKELADCHGAGIKDVYASALVAEAMSDDDLSSADVDAIVGRREKAALAAAELY